MGRAVIDFAGVPSLRVLGRRRLPARRAGELLGARRARAYFMACAALHGMACSAVPAESAAAPAVPSESSSAPVASRAGSARLICQALGPRERTRELSARGRAELEASRDGEHYVSARFEPAMALLREAAHGGERLAQSVYGQTRFSTLFQLEAPRPEQRELYVEALTYWRTAALAEPEHDTSGITLATPERLDSPLSELPAPWLRDAWARAEAWIRCHGLPW
jgi:hypothetical protein